MSSPQANRVAGPNLAGRPWLVITSGLPSAGKSTYASYLEKKHGFYKISSDDLRQRIFGGVFDHKYRSSELSGAKENVLLQTIQIIKLEQLSRGRNVVIDSMALQEQLRHVLFDTCINNKYALIVRRTLLNIKVSDEVCDQRNAARGGSSRFKPSHVKDGGSDFYHMVSLPNDDRQQQTQNFKYLDSYFS